MTRSKEEYTTAHFVHIPHAQMARIRRRRKHRRSALNTLRQLWKLCRNALSLRGKQVGRGTYNAVFECRLSKEYVFREPHAHISQEDRDDEARGQYDVDFMPTHKNLLQQPFPNILTFASQIGVISPNITVLPRLDESLDSVYTKLCPSKGMDRNTLGCVMRGILCGVAHLHRHGRVHLDLKPDNVMIQWNGATPGDLKDPRVCVKVVDYGFLETIGHKSEGRGSDGYKAPEQDNARCVHKASADVYSLGVLLSELTLRPSSEPRRFVEWCTARRKDPSMLESEWKALSGWTAAEARTVSKCLHTDERKRTTLAMLQTLF